jgi:hypothetical protein
MEILSAEDRITHDGVVEYWEGRIVEGRNIWAVFGSGG